MRIAVVIPALDESSQIEAAIASALQNRSSHPSRVRGGGGGSIPFCPTEIVVIVADGGSADDTCERARSAGARVVSCERGRAVQLQAGLETPEAMEAEVVLMLHADTRLASGWAQAAVAALADPRVVGGAFRFGFDPAEVAGAAPGERLALRIVEWGARWRVRWLGFPYGDQALFARRDVLQAIGGIPQVRLMEDLDLVRALRSRGRLAAVDLPAPTSARRHLERGVLRTAFAHIAAALADAAGVSRERTAHWLAR